MRRPLLFASLLTLALTACTGLGSPPPPGDVGLWPEAPGATENGALRELLREDWQLRLRAHPEWATELGDPRYHGRLTDNSINGRERRRDEIWELQRRLGEVDVDALGPDDRLNLELFGELLQREMDDLSAKLEEWQVDPLAGPHVDLLRLAEIAPTATARERAQLLERWAAVPEFLRREGEGLLRGLSAGRVAAASSVKKSIAQLDRILATPPLLSPLLTPALGGGRLVPLEPDGTLSEIAVEHLGQASRQNDLRAVNPHLIDNAVRALGTHVLVPAPDDPLTPAERGEFFAEVRELVIDDLYPALAGYRTVLSDKLLPEARGDDRAGLVWMPAGEELYEDFIERHVGVGRSARELHGIGLEQVAKVRAQMLALGGELFGTESFLQLRVRLADDEALHFASGEEIVELASATVARAEAAVPAVFSELPSVGCEVLPVPAAEAPESTTAYYRGPSEGLGTPGRYYVNTFEPATRPRYEAEALAFHEAVPGHHTQIALAQELDGLPLFRRRVPGSTAFVEGWALYAEKLADELGLYSSPLDRLGMLSYDAWRAARLVVDTGLHADGWSRPQAIRYLRDNTLLSDENIENEVDRYIAWPGQALAYKLGELRIFDLRRLVENRLGQDFSLAQFHNELLRHGAVPLGVLRDQITRWLGV